MALDLQQVHQEMLDRIDNRYQKTVGFPAYDFTRAFALAVLSLDGDISIAEANLRIENMTGQWLDDYILQHSGLVRKYGTYATTNLRVVTGAGEIRAGDLFSTLSGVEFYATTDGYYEEGDTFPVRAYLAGQTTPRRQEAMAPKATTTSGTAFWTTCKTPTMAATRTPIFNGPCRWLGWAVCGFFHKPWGRTPWRSASWTRPWGRPQRI